MWKIDGRLQSIREINRSESSLDQDLSKIKKDQVRTRHDPAVILPLELLPWKEDLFGDGLPFYDLLVSLDAHLDLFCRRTIDPIKHEWEARARPITEEWKARAKEAQLALEATFNSHQKSESITRSDSISITSSGFSLLSIPSGALSEAQKLALKTSSENSKTEDFFRN
ncbi:hypothetical protein DFH28DRAFT_938132 [Melampsora americana]|nr:hypothetical protein DFH28DRAFT_938132 [Melampsora americana]